ncbi:hypothetical protein ACFQPG_02330 [Sphingomonas sp. GCM10030256]|uniref:hypothetical protein n=1 Tax=Sphingomonas sp. GCM10030256 TaxID=3273427 RepID=UPI003620E6BD
MNAPHKLALFLAAIAVAVPQPVSAKAPSKAWAGTWDLNSAKSKFSSPDSATKSETRTYTVSGNRLTMRSTMVDAAGKTIKWSYSAGLDGKWYRMIGNPNADQISLTSVGKREVKSQARLNGKASARATATLSADGKQITIRRSILTAKGGPTDDTLVYDRMK